MEKGGLAFWSHAKRFDTSPVSTPPSLDIPSDLAITGQTFDASAIHKHARKRFEREGNIRINVEDII
jgi:hypothetical protein